MKLHLNFLRQCILLMALCVGHLASAADEVRSYRLAVGESLVYAGQKYVCHEKQSEARSEKKEGGLVSLFSADKPIKVGDVTIRCGEGFTLQDRHAFRDFQQL